jgi:DNA-binding FadR family transcriptional regulator
VFTALGFVAAGETVIHQSIEAGIGHRVHMAATSAIAAIGAAEFFVFFVAKRHAAIATITGNNVYVCFINEFHGSILKTKAPTGGAFAGE